MVACISFYSMLVSVMAPVVILVAGIIMLKVVKQNSGEK